MKIQVLCEKMVYVIMEKSFIEIDQLRNRLGIAQAEMCRAADVSESTISKARSSQRELSPRIRRKLIRALDQIAVARGVTVINEDHKGGADQ